MNTTPSSRKINWHQAAAEVVLIVAGILVALAVDSWWEERAERATESHFLKALKEDFLTNRELLVIEIKIQEQLISVGKEILLLI